MGLHQRHGRRLGRPRRGKSTAELDAYLSQFDEWDRYDFDEDGDFDEPDGYIDHFQAVHAGEGEEAGADPDAIWSHRWYVNPTTAGSDGPTVGGKPNLNGGARIGDSSYFIGDYTVEPENGGLGVFAHEYGHDLGLPDFYDTNGGDNGTVVLDHHVLGLLARPRRRRRGHRHPRPAASARRRSSSSAG